MHQIAQTQNFFEWCVKAHADTNHMYDKYLPYEFHLRLARQVGWEYRAVIPILDWPQVDAALGGHDVIEDTRKSCNDVKEAAEHAGFSLMEAFNIRDMIYACTVLRGRNREERANEEYYSLIRETKYASFVKLCDRIANVRYSIMVKSRMTDVYRKELPSFLERIGGEYPEMRTELMILLK